MRPWKQIVGVVMACSLVGCASVPAPVKYHSPTAMHLEGLFSVHSARGNESGHFVWDSELSGDFSLEVSGPLGLDAAELTQVQHQVVLTAASGKKYTAASPEALIKQLLGEAIPITGFRFWLLGQPAPHHEYVATYDAKHRLTELIQSDWKVNYTWMADASLPQKILMQHEDIRVLLVIKSA